MATTKLKEGIYWVGAVDWNLRYFHGPTYSTHRGTTYNSYLILDEEPTLVDGVYPPFKEELISNIRSLIDPAKLKYVVVNHLEWDHVGAIPDVMAVAPQATVLCSPKAEKPLKKIFPESENWDIRVVKTGEAIKIGKRTLAFVEAPMLHWPDSMFTYIPEEKLLLPNDAFGQHIATSGRFDDEADMTEVMQEARKYYANILLPFSSQVIKKLEEVTEMGLEIDMIGPSHGVIWRKDPGKIIESYASWAKQETKKKAVIVYDTMWNSTGKMAHAILEGLVEKGVEVKLYKISSSDKNDIISDLMDAKIVLVGSSTINREFIPSLSAFLDDMMGLKPRNKLAAFFGSSGWSGGAVKGMRERMEKAGFDLAEENMEVKWVPTEEEFEKCRTFGRRLGDKIS